MFKRADVFALLSAGLYQRPLAAQDFVEPGEPRARQLLCEFRDSLHALRPGPGAEVLPEVAASAKELAKPAAGEFRPGLPLLPLARRAQGAAKSAPWALRTSGTVNPENQPGLETPRWATPCKDLGGCAPQVLPDLAWRRVQEREARTPAKPGRATRRQR